MHCGICELRILPRKNIDHTMNTSGTPYHQISNIMRTKYQNSNVSRLVLQLSLPNPLKTGVQLKMKM